MEREITTICEIESKHVKKYKIYLENDEGHLSIDEFNHCELSDGFTPEKAGEIFVSWVKSNLESQKARQETVKTSNETP